MKCKDVTEYIDLGKFSGGWNGLFSRNAWMNLRIQAHLLFCKACRFYLRLSEILRRGMRQALELQWNGDEAKRARSDVEARLMKRLVEKFSKRI